MPTSRTWFESLVVRFAQAFISVSIRGHCVILLLLPLVSIVLAVFICDSHSHLEAFISFLHHEKHLFSLSVSVVSSEGPDKSKEVNLILKIWA